jgi:hypothetical protein
MKGLPPTSLNATIVKLVQTNKVWFTKDIALFSVIPLPGFVNIDLLMTTDLKGYKFDLQGSLIPDGAPVLNFDQVITLLKDKNFEGSESASEFDKITKDSKSFFLDGSVKTP